MSEVLKRWGEKRNFPELPEEPGNLRLSGVVTFTTEEAMLNFAPLGLSRSEWLNLSYHYPEPAYGDRYYALLQGSVSPYVFNSLTNLVVSSPEILNVAVEVETVGFDPDSLV